MSQKTGVHESYILTQNIKNTDLNQQVSQKVFQQRSHHLLDFFFLVMLTVHPTGSQQNKITLQLARRLKKRIKRHKKNTHKHTNIYNMSVVRRNT